MRIAIVGCGHGALDTIYETVQQSEAETGIPVDMVLISGDFQAVRNTSDFRNLAVPPKYRHLGDFHQYYSGAKKAPYLTLFIGGNHESSAYMWELYHGGWAAPNIYYLGWANVLRFGDLRIGGTSGIWNPGNYIKSHYEVAPYDSNQLRSIYHTRMFEVAQLTLYNKPLDLFLSHEWPRDIALYGDLEALKRNKPFFKEDILSGKLGSPAMQHLLHHLRPSYWFAAHLHVGFPALVPHASTPKKKPIDLRHFKHTPQFTHATRTKPVLDPSTVSLDSARVTPATRPDATHARVTRFLALDKCLARRHFIQFLDLPNHTPGPLSYDRDWLAIVRATTPYLPLGPEIIAPPLPSLKVLAAQVADARAWLDEHIPDDAALQVPVGAFEMTGPLHVHGDPPGEWRELAWKPQRNPQTDAFCAMLGVECKINQDGITHDEYQRANERLVERMYAQDPQAAAMAAAQKARMEAEYAAEVAARAAAAAAAATLVEGAESATAAAEDGETVATEAEVVSDGGEGAMNLDLQ
ncbi:hypothetical protein GGF31_005894 [Allomyces arbusculus]|nr:hypothetical protein GGF31_005894 [Allomyces arbusculus]